jgi:hypothetical protein
MSCTSHHCFNYDASYDTNSNDSVLIELMLMKLFKSGYRYVNICPSIIKFIYIATCMSVTTDGVWIANRIYWTL